MLQEWLMKHGKLCSYSRTLSILLDMFLKGRILVRKKSKPLGE